LIETMRRDDPELLPFIQALNEDRAHRVPRTAVYAVANPDTVPQALLHSLKHNQVLHELNVILTVVFHEVPWIPFEQRVQVTPLAPGFWRVQVNYGFINTPDIPKALMHNLKHNQVLHEHNLILTVVFHEVPWIPFEQRVRVAPLAPGFWRVQVNYGFINTPDIPKALELCRAQGVPVNLFETSYFLSREIVVPTRNAGMAHWREALFAVMSRNAGSVADFFRLPHNCVIELGTRVQI
jgi:K+ transporter